MKGVLKKFDFLTEPTKVTHFETLPQEFATSKNVNKVCKKDCLDKALHQVKGYLNFGSASVFGGFSLYAEWLSTEKKNLFVFQK